MRLRFVVAEIFHGFRRNATMIWAVILVTFVSLSAVGAALMLQQQVDRIKGEWYDKVEVQVWLCPEAPVERETCRDGSVSQDQQDAVKAKLESPELDPYVEEVFFQSKEETYNDFLDRFGGTSMATEVTQAEFPPMFRVKLKDASKFSVVADAVKLMPGVYDTFDQSDLFDQLFNILGKIRLAALGIALVLGLAAILLITTTIRLSALSRQRETGIMRLVGASNLFIQLPFMLEGAVAALLGSALAVGTLWSVSQFWLADWVARNFAMMTTVRSSDVFAVAPYMVLAAVALAALSSVLTLRRFTKV
ncbi:MAG: permease-like cell division protein FtsX [Micrococcales bacterium]|nr:permease-like cell division protein FtsX [Micrococcales bacterium]